MSYQVEIVSLDQLVAKNHNYRKFKELWDLHPVRKELEKIEIEKGADFKGYGILRLFLCLLVQFMENLSDRELEESLKSNLASKWFCEFGLLIKHQIISYLPESRLKLELINYLKSLISSKSS